MDSLKLIVANKGCHLIDCGECNLFDGVDCELETSVKHLDNYTFFDSEHFSTEELEYVKQKLQKLQTTSKNMNSFIEYAMKEFKLAGWCDEDGEFVCETQQAICKHVLRLLDEFASEGYDGASIPYVIELFAKLAQHKPITPLTSNDEEWVKSVDDRFQNTRNSSVFKDGKNGRPYYIDAWVKVWEKDPLYGWSGPISLDNGTLITKAYIKNFSEMPTIEILIFTVHEKANSDRDFLPVSLESLDELKKYYDLEIQPLEKIKNTITQALKC